MTDDSDKGLKELCSKPPFQWTGGMDLSHSYDLRQLILNIERAKIADSIFKKTEKRLEEKRERFGKNAHTQAVFIMACTGWELDHPFTMKALEMTAEDLQGYWEKYWEVAGE